MGCFQFSHRKGYETLHSLLWPLFPYPQNESIRLENYQVFLGSNISLPLCIKKIAVFLPPFELLFFFHQLDFIFFFLIFIYLFIIIIFNL